MVAAAFVFVALRGGIRCLCSWNGEGFNLERGRRHSDAGYPRTSTVSLVSVVVGNGDRFSGRLERVELLWKWSDHWIFLCTGVLAKPCLLVATVTRYCLGPVANLDARGGRVAMGAVVGCDGLSGNSVGGGGNVRCELVVHAATAATSSNGVSRGSSRSGESVADLFV